ncbi:MAG: OmpH family outer membrane protein [Prevotellaceae bacterium]|jgi:outer membrane protein|nr:OmpH family outer membrane protein [Prevotellaceae bacterium]
MKKIIAILWLPKLLVIMLLFTACGNGGAEQGKTVDPQQNSTDAQRTVETKITDIAYVNFDSIVQNYDYYHDLKREFEQKAKKKDEEFNSKVNTLQAEVMTFKSNYEKMLLTHSEAEEQQRRLGQREIDLKEEYSKIMNQLGEEEAVMSRKVIDAIQTYVKKYNVDKKYSLILNAATIIVGAPSMDITSEILSGLNQEYIANKAK